MYYKWINGEWNIVAGSLANIVEQLPETGNSFTDYYMANENNTYSHYRYIDGEFKLVGNVGQKCHLASSLNSYGELSLVKSAVAGYTSGENLCSLRGELSKLSDILVIDMSGEAIILEGVGDFRLILERIGLRRRGLEVLDVLQHHRGLVEGLPVASELMVARILEGGVHHRAIGLAFHRTRLRGQASLEDIQP